MLIMFLELIFLSCVVYEIQALREQIENYNKQIGIIQERIKIIQQTRMPDKDPYKATIMPLPMSGVLPPPPKIYIPPETPPSPVSKHRTVTKETITKEKYTMKPQSPLDPKFSYAAAVVSGRMSPMVGSRESSPFTRCLTPSRASPRTNLFESYIKKEHIMSSSQTSEKPVRSETPPLHKSTSIEELKEKYKKQATCSSVESKQCSDVPNKKKLGDTQIATLQEKDSQTTVSDESAPVDGTSWASGFLSKPSYADILSGRVSPLPRSASPEFPDAVVTSAYQKETVNTEEGEDTIEKLESSSFRSTSYTEPSLPEPVIEMPESPDNKSKQQKSKKLSTTPQSGHFVKEASPKFFDLKTRTPSPSPSNRKEYSESRVSSTSVSKTVVFSEGAKHVTQTESSHSQIETKSFCASPQESRKLTYAQVARMSSPVEGSRSASPRLSSSQPHSQTPRQKHDSPKTPESSSSKSNQKSFLEVDPDNRNRPKLNPPKHSEQSKQNDQNQKNLIRPLFSIEEGALNVHLLSRGGSYQHPLFCEIFQVSQEFESGILQHIYCVFGIAKTSHEVLLHDAMSLFSSVRNENNSAFLSSGPINISSNNCAHINQRLSLNQEAESVLLCLYCGSLFIDNVAAFPSKFANVSNYSYWDALASYFLNSLKERNAVVFSSLFPNPIHFQASDRSSKGYFTPVPTSSPLLQCMFHPSNKTKKKPRIKLLQNFCPDAVIVTDNSKYLCIPVTFNCSRCANVEEEVESPAWSMIKLEDVDRKKLEVSF